MPYRIPTLGVVLGTLLGLGLGCPAQVPTAKGQAESAKASPTPPGVGVIDEDNPGVVRDTDDLYAIGTAPNPPKPEPAPGAGRPDTSNGECKLFSPKLPKPECCPFETGFDAEKIKQLCGHALYMGESLYQSCGYYFLPKMANSAPVALRASKLNRETVKKAAAVHDERMAHTLKLPEFASTPVPGVEGAMWSEHENVHWAFLPGWSTVRLVSWTDDACPIAAMPKVLKLIAEAKEVPPEAPRRGLIPQARK